MGMGWAGCGLDSNFSDLGEKLLDPDLQGLDTPGQQLLSGAHFDLGIQADEAGERYALARNPDGELSIVDFARETHCRTAEVVRYGTSLSAPGQRALIPILVTGDDGATKLAFTNFACERSEFTFATGGLPVQTLEGLSTDSGTGVLIRTPSQGLALIDPWVGREREVAVSVRARIDPVRAFGHFLWIDRGVITISDDQLAPLAYFGSDVVEVAISPEDSELAYIEAGAEAGHGGNLYVVDPLNLDTPREIAADACAVRYLSVAGRRQLSYLSPCTERRLLFQDRASEELRVVDSNVLGDPLLRTIAGESFLTYVTAPEPDASGGTLWLIRGDAEKVAIAENARVRPSGVSPSGGLLTVLDWASTGGRLVEWKDDALKDIAGDVIELGTLGLLEGEVLTFLGNFDGNSGDLMRLNPDLSTDVLATGVPLRAAEEDAFLANFDGDSGDLMLLDRANGDSEWLAAGVARGSFGVAQQFRGVIMLSERDPETNTSTLRLHLVETGQQYVVNSGVTETREVAFPSPGLLYNVMVGENAGLWYSKAL